MTTLSLEAHARTSLPYPYPTGCIDSWSETVFVRYKDTLLYRIVSKLEYSQGFCTVLCNIKNAFEECDCYESRFQTINLKFLLRGQMDNGMDCLAEVKVHYCTFEFSML